MNKYKYGSAIPTISKQDLLNIVVPLFNSPDTINEIEENVKKAYEYKKLAQEIMMLNYN